MEPFMEALRAAVASSEPETPPPQQERTGLRKSSLIKHTLSPVIPLGFLCVTGEDNTAIYAQTVTVGNFYA